MAGNWGDVAGPLGRGTRAALGRGTRIFWVVEPGVAGVEPRGAGDADHNEGDWCDGFEKEGEGEGLESDGDGEGREDGRGDRAGALPRGNLRSLSGDTWSLMIFAGRGLSAVKVGGTGRLGGFMLPFSTLMLCVRIGDGVGTGLGGATVMGGAA